MLPWSDKFLSQGNDHGALLYMSACIITAQLVMVPVAAWPDAPCAVYGRKWVLMIGFSVCRFARAVHTDRASHSADRH